jgi:Rieske Fe-S protein
MTYRLRNDPELLNTEFFINDISEYSSGIKLINDHEYLIVRRQGNDIKIYDGLCTHLDCIVKYRNDSNDIFCNCHGGRFDMNGNVLEGPPKKPLKIYNYEITGNKVVIKS